MFFFLGLGAFLLGAQLWRWIRSHIAYDIQWQECPICKGGGKTPNQQYLACMTCLGFGGWSYTTKRWLSRSTFDRPFD